MKKCIIVGAGTYGQVYASYLSEYYDISGFVDDNAALHGKVIDGIKVLGNREFSIGFLTDHPGTAVFAPIGNNAVRCEILSEYAQKGFDTPSFVHPQTIIHPSVQMGKGVYILPATNIMPATKIGDFVMISMGVNIAHHNQIATGCFFSQGSNIGASMEIGAQAYFGIGATVMSGIRTIGQSALIGAGTMVIKDVPDFAVVVGNPARIIRYTNSESS